MKPLLKSAIVGCVILLFITAVTVPLVLLSTSSPTTQAPGTTATTSNLTTTTSQLNTTTTLTPTTKPQITSTISETSSSACLSSVTTEATTTATISPAKCTPKGVLANYGTCKEDAAGKCYCVYRPFLPDGWVWSNAKWYCSNISMALLSIQDVTEEQFVASLANEGEFWISARRSSVNLEWTWTSTGENVGYKNWAISDFNNQLGCASLKIAQGNPLFWYVNDCSGQGYSKNYWFICEDPSTPAPSPSGCPSNNYNYAQYMTWHPGVIIENKLYCFSSHWMMVEDARRICSMNSLKAVSLQDAHKNEIIMQYINEKKLDIGGGFWTSGECDGATWKWMGVNQQISFNLLNSSDPLSTCGPNTFLYSIWISGSSSRWYSNTNSQYRQIICEAP